MVHRLEADYWGQVDFVYLDREDNANADVVREYGVRGQPIFVFIAPDGTELARWFGAVDASTLQQAFDDYLASNG